MAKYDRYYTAVCRHSVRHLSFRFEAQLTGLYGEVFRAFYLDVSSKSASPQRKIMR